jgi:hypothetical protein
VKSSAFCVVTVAALAALAATSAQASDAKASPIDARRLSDITREMSADEFEGRAPGTPGEARTIAYLVERFRAVGLEPAGPNGAYTQVVPLVRTQVPADAAMSVTVAGKRRPLVQQVDMAALALRPVDRVTIQDAPRREEVPLASSRCRNSPSFSG